mmetsp:Transcript_17705/g.46692  ORF Transcript_17705/g.46692 Transcript_17705/m.46692 type:complete len:202 (-) Transcript_17705:25-630(-)
MLLMDSAASASRSGSSRKRSREKAHEVIERSCGVNCSSCALDGAAMACISGGSRTLRVATAHAVFARVRDCTGPSARRPRCTRSSPRRQAASRAAAPSSPPSPAPLPPLSASAPRPPLPLSAAMRWRAVAAWMALSTSRFRCATSSTAAAVWAPFSLCKSWISASLRRPPATEAAFLQSGPRSAGSSRIAPGSSRSHGAGS